MKIEYLGFIDAKFAVIFCVACVVVSFIAFLIFLRNPRAFREMGTASLGLLIGCIAFMGFFLHLSSIDVKDGIKELYGIELKKETVAKMSGNYNLEMTDFVPTSTGGTENIELEIYSFSIEDGYISIYKRHGDKYILIEPTR